MSQQDRAVDFRRMHAPATGRILVLPNVWDAMSARLVEEAGARAIATTSSGVSWSLGRPDGHGLTRDEMMGVVHRIVNVVRVPVTADIEGGYGRGTVADVEETVRRVIGAGAVGINLEDTPGTSGEILIDAALQAERIGAARRVADAEGVDLFINARIDVFLFEAGEPEGRFDQTVNRAHVYRAAGSDGIFVPGVADAPTIQRLASAVGAPLNVMAGPGSPSVSELANLGVTRVSVGPAIARTVMACIRHAAGQVLRDGTYDTLQGSMAFPEANGLFSRAE
ncbi:MAG: isocitrate lyase/phosphoenolpyruvate mutase family protein [Gemmatimonadetes bacterium]|nr:isocitrate lyase/phosphoenolpyruvate mutase family protein [Gemmatimonadota bacterium]